MKKQNGFTLIELVIVIIILGILAAVAVPKFVDLQGDARVSSLQGVKAALEGGSTLAYSQAAIDGVEKVKTQNNLDINGETVHILSGYPDATDAGILKMVDLGASDWGYSGNTVSADVLLIFASGATSTAQAACNVSYKLGTSGARPTITVNDEC